MKAKIIIAIILVAALLNVPKNTIAQVPPDTNQLRTKVNIDIVPNAVGGITAAKLNPILNGILNLMKAYAIDSSYRIADTLFLTRRGGFTTIKVTLASGGAPSESDPTVSAAAKSISGGDVINWNSKQPAISNSATVSIISNVVSAANNTALWNANKLQGRNISASSPTTNQVLAWSGSAWVPADPAIGTGDGNNLTTSIAFNIADGILTTSRSGLANLELDLDGRYIQGFSRSGDSIFALINGVQNFAFKDSIGSGGGSVNLDSLRDANSVTITNPGGTSAKILAADIASNKAGVMTVQMKRILDSTVTRIVRQDDSVRNYYNSLGVLIFKDTTKSANPNSFVYKSMADLRAVGTYDTGKIYRVITYYKTIGDYYWVPGCTDPEDSVMNLNISGLGCLKRYYESYVLANWWPIKDDAGVTDNSYYMNKIKTFMRSQTKASRVLILPGDYAFDNWFWTRDDNADGQLDFISFSVEGAGAPPYATSQVVGPTVILRKFSPQGFLIGWQQGRNVQLKNLHLQGFANIPASYDQAITWPTSSWLYSGVTNGRYNPDDVLILIDPLHASVTGGNRYASISSMYTPTGSSGTSFVTIDNCAFNFSNIAIGLSFNGTTLNGDNVILNNCVQSNNRIFFASGQNQTRSNAINGLYSLGGSQKIIDCSTYGAQQGSPPALNFCNIAGITKQIWDYNGSFSQLLITGGYYEGFHTLGRSGALPVQSLGVHYKPLIPSDNGTFAPSVFAEGTSVNFTNSTIQWFDNTWAAGLPFNVDNLSFKSSDIWSGVPTNGNYKNQSITFDAVTFRNQFGESMITDNNFVSDLDASQVNGRWLLPGMKFQMSGNKLVMESYDDKIQIRYLESHTINIDTTTHTASFTATNIGKYQLYDLIWVDNVVTDTINNYNPTQTSLGWVSDITGSVVTLKAVPFGVNEVTTYNMYHARFGKLKNRVLGDVTNGSNIITNTKSTSAHFVVGDKIHGIGIPDGYYVTNVNAGAFTITISGNATATNTNVELYDTKIVQYARNNDPTNVSAGNPGFFKGDFVLNNLTSTNTDTVERWVATAPGFNGTANLPTFKNLKFNTGGGVGGSDHNALSNLTTGDVHTQYPFLNGRSGGQILKGGTGASDVLSLYSTSGAGSGAVPGVQIGVGTNGASKAITVLQNGQVGVNRLTTGGYNFLVEGVGGFTNGTFGSSLTYEGTYLNVANGSNDFSLRMTAYGKRFDIGLSNTKARIQPMIDNTIPFGIMSTTKDLLLFDFAADSIKAYSPFIVNAGAKFSGTVTLPASTTAASSMILQSGTIPSAPVEGAFGWSAVDSAFYYRTLGFTFKIPYGKSIVPGNNITFGRNSDPNIPDTINANLTGGGITSLNGLTGSTQTFSTPGTSGIAPGWVSTGTAHELNIPLASTASVTLGGISKTDYDNFNNKQSTLVPVAADPTDWTAVSGTLTALPDLTGAASHTVTMPSAATYSGKPIVINNTSTDASFKWTFAGTNVKDATGATVTAIDDQTITSYFSDGTNWLKYASQPGGTGGGGTWGSITGTLSNQTDLNSALNGKEASITTGTTSQYWRGDKSFQTLNKSAVGLANVDNTSDAGKPVSTATQTALDLKANLASPTFTGTVGGITAAMVGLGNVTNESKSTMFSSPTFTGTVSGVTATHVGLGNVTNESKPTMFTNSVFTGITTVNSLNTALQSIATAAGTTTLTSASPYQTIFTGTTTQTVVLPDATTLTVGQRYKISNNSTGLVTVQTNGGATLWILGASTDIDLVALTIGTAAGTWERDYRVGNNSSGKVATFNSSSSFSGTDGVTYTFPTVTTSLGSYAVTTEASNATPTVSIAGFDHLHTITALAAAATFGAPTGTFVDGNELTIRIKDNGTARTLAWNAAFRASGDLALPTTTVLGKTMYVKFRRNGTDSVWDLLAVLNNF